MIKKLAGIIGGFSLPILAVAIFGSAANAEMPSIVGVWLTEGGKSHVEIAQCGAMLCGKIVWLREPNDESGKPKIDKNNENTELRARPLISLPILADFKPISGSNKWDDGSIYNPEDGKSYDAIMTLEDQNTLRVRGYVGISLFGKSQIWTRVEP